MCGDTTMENNNSFENMKNKAEKQFRSNEKNS